MKSDMHAWHWLLGSALHNGEWCLLSWYWCCRVLTATPVAPASAETYNVVHIDASKVSFILVGLNKVFLYGHLCRAVFGIVSSVCRSVAFRSIIPKWNVLEMSNLVTLVNWQCVFWTEREDDTSRLNFLINMTWFYFTAYDIHWGPLMPRCLYQRFSNFIPGIYFFLGIPHGPQYSNSKIYHLKFDQNDSSTIQACFCCYNMKK